MFLRKLVVIFVPLLLAGLLCVAIPLILQLQLGFWTNVLMGGLLGVSLGLLLSLSGLSKRREPFAGLLWVPLIVLTAVVVMQFFEVLNAHGSMVMVECAFIGYMLVAALRTKK